MSSPRPRGMDIDHPLSQMHPIDMLDMHSLESIKLSPMRYQFDFGKRPMCLQLWLLVKKYGDFESTGRPMEQRVAFPYRMPLQLHSPNPLLRF